MSDTRDAEESTEALHHGGKVARASSSERQVGPPPEIHMSSTSRTDEEIDEGLYSRMLYVMGTDGLKKLASSSVVICGLDGLGAELAKNVVLGGVSRVCLCDVQKTTAADLGTQFFLRKEDVGRNRAEACSSRVAELNNYVTVTARPTYATSEVINEADVVVVCNCPPEYERQTAQYCHDSKIKFISVQTHGVSGRIFCDFGKDFVVVDPAGATPQPNTVLDVTNDAEGVVTVSEERRHGYEDGTFVQFSHVKGMNELNCASPFKVKYIAPYSFSIGDTSNMGAFEGTALVTEVIQPLHLDFLPLNEAIKSPRFVEYDFAKFNYPCQLHLSYLAIERFLADKRRMPALQSDDDASMVLDLAKHLNEELKLSEDVDESLIKAVSKTYLGQLCPMQAFVGGIASQEVMKACTHKFTPIRQFFYFEAFECLPEESLQVSDLSCDEERYDLQCALLGKSFIEKLQKTNLFVVGMGALGCELLKCFALMGIGCAKQGQVTITDMDTIGKSNLNRQFLFRPWDIGKMKTRVAAESIAHINPSMNINCHENRISVESEQVYDDRFFEQLDCVVNALDNVQTRTYVDLRCVYYRKPLLESGTLGTRANTQVVLPHLTESYSSSQDPPEKQIPMCTLKNFPHAIEHTIQWARDYFEEVFYLGPLGASKFLKNPVSFVEEFSKHSDMGCHMFEASSILKILSNPIRSFEECVARARQMFDDNFINQIKQLLFNFPKDMKTTQGIEFWYPPKKCPHSIEYCPEKHSLHADFVFVTANLLADVYGIKRESSMSVVLDIASKVVLKQFIPKAGVKIATTDTEAEAMQTEGAQNKDSVLKELLALRNQAQSLTIEPLEFEKDDDSNLHVDFITACSNLRAENYDIEPADRLQTKMIAGKIIPAIATTTSAVVGLVCLELIKVLQGKKSIEQYRNGFFDLADSSFVFSEPVPAPKKKYRDTEYTLWDRIDIEGEKTLGDIIQFFEETYNVNVSMISHDVMMLYASFTSRSKKEERSAMTVPEVIESLQKKPLAKHLNAVVIEISCEDKDNGEDVEFPYVRYILNRK